MSEKYYYTKDLSAEVLTEAIQLRTTIRKEFVTCLVTMAGDGSLPEDNVSLEFDRALTSSEQDEITNIVNAIGPTYDLVIRKNIELGTMAWAEQKGHMILRQFASNNMYQGKTDDQVDALATKYPDIIHTLVTGSLTASYRLFSSMVPDENISQDEIDEFTLRLAIILGL